MNSLKPINRKNWLLRHKLLTVLVVALLATVAWETEGQKYVDERRGISATDNSGAQSTTSPSPSSTTVNGKSVTSSSSSSTTVTSGTSAAAPTPTVAASAGKYKMTISGSSATTSASGATVTGHITNNEEAQHSATIQATFFDKSGTSLGVATGSVSNVQPAQTQAFTLKTTQNVVNYDHMVVQVSSIQ